LRMYLEGGDWEKAGEVFATPEKTVRGIRLREEKKGVLQH